MLGKVKLTQVETGAPSAGRNHQFDLLRIVFAVMVLLAHAPEITDGNQHRELLARLTRSHFTFGALGVDGFFLLSGFLIVNSWQHTSKLLPFAKRRFFRIVPGYLVAALLSTFVVGLLAPGTPHFFSQLNIHFVKSVMTLSSPSTPPVLPGNNYPLVNGSLWTIPFECRCYVLVALFGLAGLLRRRAVWLIVTVALLVAALFPGHWAHYDHTWFARYFGTVSAGVRLTSVYFVGGCYMLFRDRVRFRRSYALAAAALMVALPWWKPNLTESAAVLFGGYLMFYLSEFHLSFLDPMRSIPDVSYGIYLYGWPVESMLIWFLHVSPWTIFGFSTVLCCGLGWLSWVVIERPMMRFTRSSIRKDVSLLTPVT
jgi:peptidoglycan/LPS O-acetylase OafA/YrhL